MKVKVLKEAGYEEALYGMSLSFKDRSISKEDWWTEDRFEKLCKKSEVQHKMDGGHNKFLESIQMWIELEAPRGFWQEYDTYRVGVSKQSDSSMHTIQKRLLTADDFEPGTDSRAIDILNEILTEVTDNFSTKGRLTGEALQKVKWNIPEGFLQNRVVCLNYKVLRAMILQRHDHKLSQWQIFIDNVRDQCAHPELLPKP